MKENIENLICRGIKTHNLKNIDLDLPLNSWIAVTGVSGSGKSSLVFDTIYAEAQRRFLETLGTYERQFLQGLPMGIFNEIDNIPAAIALKQSNKTANPRSVISTASDIDVPLRTIFMSLMDPACTKCGSDVNVHFSSELIHFFLSCKNMNSSFIVTVPFVLNTSKLCKDLISEGYTKVVVDEEIVNIEDIGSKYKLPKNIQIILDRISTATASDEITNRVEAVWSQIKFSPRFFSLRVTKLNEKNKPSEEWSDFHVKPFCKKCHSHTSIIQESDLDWHSILGSCESCHGLGSVPVESENEILGRQGGGKFRSKYARYHTKYTLCPSCLGARIGLVGRNARCYGKSYQSLFQDELSGVLDWLISIKNENKFKKKLEAIQEIYKELFKKISLLIKLGMSSHQLFRRCKTLSGGEYQRVLLTRVIGNGLTDALYVLDEPSVGLGKNEIPNLIQCIRELCELGNTVIMVEHDKELIHAADHVIELGPSGGEEGGFLLEVKGKIPASFHNNFLNKKNLKIKQAVSTERIFKKEDSLFLEDFSALNCHNLNVEVLLGKLNVISGPSGAGKSTIINFGIKAAIEKYKESKVVFNKELNIDEQIGCWKEFVFPKNFFETFTPVFVDQKSLHRSIASVPATVLGIMDDLRKHFASTFEAKTLGLEIADFSFNGAGGCKLCKGRGTVDEDLFFLGQVEKICPECDGCRFRNDVLEVKWKNRNIHQWLSTSFRECLNLFGKNIGFSKILMIACQLGLGHIPLGLSTRSMSGGEAQRLRICAALTKADQKIFCIIDEPTRGLSETDIGTLIETILNLCIQGHTFVIVEHHELFIEQAHHVLLLGPESGKNGGRIIERLLQL